MASLRILAWTAFVGLAATWTGCPRSFRPWDRIFFPEDDSLEYRLAESRGLEDDTTLLKVLELADAFPQDLPRLIEDSNATRITNLREAEALVRVLTRFPLAHPRVPKLTGAEAVRRYDARALNRVLAQPATGVFETNQPEGPTRPDGLPSVSLLQGELSRPIPASEDEFEGTDAPLVEPLVAACDLACSIWQEEGHDYLIYHGTRELCRIADTLIADPTRASELEFLAVLRALAYLEVAEGTERIVLAIRRGIHQDNPNWRWVLEEYYESHAEVDAMMQSLRRVETTGWLDVAILEMANKVHRDGWSGVHLYDWPGGRNRLRGHLLPQNLTNNTADDFPDPQSRESTRERHRLGLERRQKAQQATAAAQAAATALGFLQMETDELVDLGLRSIDRSVRWASLSAGVRNGHVAAIDAAVDACRRVETSIAAQRLLSDYHLADRIPEVAREPSFVTRSRVADELISSYGSQLEIVSLAILDERELHWPPADERRKLALVSYHIRTVEMGSEPSARLPTPRFDTQNVALVGGELGVALGHEETEDLSPREIYALYVCQEMIWTNHPSAPRQQSVPAGLRILRRQNPDFR